MLSRLWTQRRRTALAYLAFFATLWASLASGAAPSDLDPFKPLTLISLAIAVLIVVTPVMAILIFALPRWLHVLEILLLAIMADLLLTQVIPDAASPILNTARFVALVFIVQYLLYGQMLTGNLMALPRPRRRVFRTKASPSETFGALLPHPDHAGRHWYPGTQFTEEPNAQGEFFVTYPLRNRPEPLSEWITIEEATEARSFRIRFRLTHPGDAIIHSGTSAVTLTPLENGGTEVSITEAIDPAPFRRRLQWWLDDEFRDRTNAMRAYLDGRPDWSMIARQFPKDAKGKRQTARAAEVFS